MLILIMADFIFLTETGKRDNNEDSFGNYKKEFFLVCDGLGGRPAGEVASKIAVETALKEYGKIKGPKKVEEIFQAANQEISQKVKENPNNLGMGSTMVAVILNNNSIVIANVGDCRAYLFSSDGLLKLTKDDRDPGGFLIRALGMIERVKPKVKTQRVKKGDTLFLCSDGLHDFVSDQVIEKILNSQAGLQSKVKGLVEAALQFGSTDNITTGLIKI